MCSCPRKWLAADSDRVGVAVVARVLSTFLTFICLCIDTLPVVRFMHVAHAMAHCMCMPFKIDSAASEVQASHQFASFVMQCISTLDVLQFAQMRIEARSRSRSIVSETIDRSPSSFINLRHLVNFSTESTLALHLGTTQRPLQRGWLELQSHATASPETSSFAST